MGPVGDEVILSNFPHALMCVEDAQAKCFGLKERELVPALKGDLNQPPTAIPAMLSTLLPPFQLVPGFRPLLSGLLTYSGQIQSIPIAAGAAQF